MVSRECSTCARVAEIGHETEGCRTCNASYSNWIAPSPLGTAVVARGCETCKHDKKQYYQTPCDECEQPATKWEPATPATPAPSAPADVNPKDRVGATKAPLTLLPSVAVLHGAHAMSNGAAKYGAYNWRGHPVIASIYLDACLRHVHAWHDGEERADDSGVHHLGHALACLAILLDAQATGNLVDDRPKGGGAFAKALVDVNAAIKASK